MYSLEQALDKLEKTKSIQDLVELLKQTSGEIHPDKVIEGANNALYTGKIPIDLQAMQDSGNNILGDTHVGLLLETDEFNEIYTMIL